MNDSYAEQAFIIVGEADISNDKSDSANYSIETGNKRRKSDGKQPFRLYFDPKSINDLLDIENMKEILGSSFVFIQNKKDSSTQLLFNNLNCFFPHYDFIDVDELKINERIPNKLIKVKKRNLIGNLLGENKRKTVDDKASIMVVEPQSENELRELCEDISKSKSRKNGIWVRGYIWDLNPYTISLFDAMFVFDMSVNEYEVLRSAIDLTEDLVNEMRSSPQDENPKGKVLFFLNREKVIDGPLLLNNPVLFNT